MADDARLRLDDHRAYVMTGLDLQESFPGGRYETNTIVLIKLTSGLNEATLIRSVLGRSGGIADLRNISSNDLVRRKADISRVS